MSELTSQPDLIPINVALPLSVLEQLLASGSPTTGDEGTVRLKLAKYILGARRRRLKTLPAIRFGEPSWDMILDLYIATVEERRVDMSGLCLASGVAPTTAVRYVEMLVTEKLIGRVADAHDGRRTYVMMLPPLQLAIERWLDAEGAILKLMGQGRGTYSTPIAPAP
jgi:hypothetical protein